MPEEAEELLRLDVANFIDERGYEVLHWVSEAYAEVAILVHLQRAWIAPDAQPSLRVGHLNGVALRALGTALPSLVWREEREGAAPRTTSSRPDELRRDFLTRAAGRSSYGCRAWMAGLVREGRDPPWARTMLDQDGKITAELLLKTTLVCEMLQEEGRVATLLDATKGTKGAVAAVEKALGTPLSELEERWQRWLLPERPTGLLQRLRAPAAPSEAAADSAAFLLALRQVRASALRAQDPEVQTLAFEPELARAAELHARYLALNPELKSRWPAMHEEYADAPGFTPEGALAARNSVIAYNGAPERALAAWLGSFYHRLPLLDPGLFGVGLGQHEEVVVLDVGSLVLTPWKDHVVLWPPPEAEGVPRANVPELPYPVPDEDQARLGQPVSVQLFFAREEGDVALELELFEGGPGERPVEAYSISPQAPLQPELAPRNAWGLVPKRWLAPKTRYSARARWSGQERVWSFTTGP
jgi:uncharacterized protein YkwD